MTRLSITLLLVIPALAAAEPKSHIEIARLAVDDLFVGSTDTLLSTAYDTLRPIATELRATNDEVLIAVHTDRFGKPTRNLALSYTQAERLRKAFIGLGLKPERLRAVGYGEAQPLNTDGTAAGERENRRVELWVRAVTRR